MYLSCNWYMSAWERNNIFNSSYQTPSPGASCVGNRIVNVCLGLEVVFMSLGTGREIEITIIVRVSMQFMLLAW